MKRKILALVLTMAILFTNIPLAAFAGNSDEADKPLEGLYISTIGDSISTYHEWSDKYPVTDEGVTNRYGEAYYAAEGDFHNTELQVTDTWWHQAATQLGAEMLMCNAGNSTGLLHASYPDNLDWQQYLQDMLAYKTRPYHLGRDGKTPDIIAIYIGSNDVAKVDAADFGTMEAVDFNTLITKNSDGTFTYATPVTVAEAYCIMMHKITDSYPDAEIYCFGVVPSAGGALTNVNSRLAKVSAFDAMVKSVADYYGAIYVDLIDGFGLDPDGNGVATQEDCDAFQSCFNNDPHPNAKGFDVITECFVDAVKENSRYIVEVETKAGVMETVGVKVTEKDGKTVSKADGYITEETMTVDYDSVHEVSAFEKNFEEKYSSVNQIGDYEAEGGRTEHEKHSQPEWRINIPLKDTDDPDTDQDDTKNAVYGDEKKVISQKGTKKENDADGVYDYTEERVEQQGVITVETDAISISETVVSKNMNDLEYTVNTTRPTDNNGMIAGYPAVTLPQSAQDVPSIADGYEYVYIGSDQLSEFWATYAYNVKTAENIAGDPIYNEGGYSLYLNRKHTDFTGRGLAVPKLYLMDRTVEAEKDADGNVKLFPGWYDSIQHFYLSDANGNVATAYCADQKTPAEVGYSYRMVNLKDSTYYSEVEANMIQCIAEKGYWGNTSGKGSLAALKEHMKASTHFTDGEIAAVNDGIAMAATQYAIWTYSNLMDNKTFYYAYNAYLNSKGNAVVGTAADDDSVALIFKLYHYLATQPVQPIERTTENTIINEKNFLENIILEVTGQPKDHPANLDDITTNDVYNVDLNFELMVKPDTTGDELVLMIMDGETVVAKGRIAGALQDGEVQLAPDESGYKFRFPSLTLEEGMQNIRFVLTGEQHLGNAAYLFTSEIIEDVGSQTMVALAEGDREVKVSMDISFSLDIENEIITKEHIWRNEKTLKGSIEGLKTDEYNTVVQGAVFGLFDADAEVFTEENALMVSTSDENGKFSFSEVPFGKYLVKELSCPEMYILNEEPVEVNITRETQQMEISVENEFVRGKVQVNKISSKKHSKKLSGAEFDVYTDVNSNGLYDADTDTFYGELIAVKKGVYELDGLKFGDYLLVETKPPKGFVRDKNYYSFSISEDGATVKVENEAGVGFTNTPKPPEDPNDPPPDTGDSSNPWIWGAVMAVSGAGALMFITDKRRRNGER